MLFHPGHKDRRNMTTHEWAAFKEEVSDPDLHRGQSFIDSIWDGFSAESPGLTADLEFLGYKKWNHLYRDGQVSRHEVRKSVEKAVAQMKSRTMKVRLAKQVQSASQEMIRMIERSNSQVDDLRSREYILQDLARELAVMMLDGLVKQQKGNLSPTPT
jgi:hypothetical protein